jgi:hypothetical protein
MGEKETAQGIDPTDLADWAEFDRDDRDKQQDDRERGGN